MTNVDAAKLTLALLLGAMQGVRARRHETAIGPDYVVLRCPIPGGDELEVTYGQLCLVAGVTLGPDGKEGPP